MTVVLFAIVLAVRGQRRVAAVLAGWAVAWFVLAIAVIIPALSPAGTFRYLESLKGRGGLHLTPAHLLNLAETDGRWHLVWLLVVTGLVVALRSPLSLLALGTLSWRLLSIGPRLHGHPRALRRGADADRLHGGAGRSSVARAAARSCAPTRTPCWQLSVVTTLAAYPLPRVFHRHFYQARPEVGEVHRLTAHVPRGARAAYRQ